MSRFLMGVDRATLIKGTAIYLVVYAVLNTCGGVGLALLGRFAQSFNLSSLSPENIGDADLAAMTQMWDVLGDWSLVVGVFFLLSVPVFAGVAWGLWNRKSWARVGTILALAFTFLLSLLQLLFGITLETLLWLLISGFGIYLYWTDEGIRRMLAE